MLGGKGFYRGTTVLVSGTSGTGKSTLSASFAKATCERGERVLYFAFEESESQIVRNMNSMGMDLQPCIDSGALRIDASRPTIFGLEAHLMNIHDAVETFSPTVVVIDPVTNLVSVGDEFEVRSMLTRIIDFLKTRQITALFTSLTTGGEAIERTEVGISSLMDTWILLRDIETDGERNRGIMVLKSRGMSHSNQVREFLMTSHGIELQDVYLGPSGVLMGSARLAQENREKTAEMELRGELVRKRREFEHKLAAARAQIAAIEAGIQADEDEIKKMEQQEQSRLQTSEEQRERMAEKRQAD
jgi:circadian clock protein KaiC